jgi:ribosomal protein S12 methylthiotransferase accessory factor
MKNSIDVYFPGGKRVDAKVNGMVVQTDQSVENGGKGSAPAPFQLFLLSIATCAGIYALEFCQTRELPVQDMTLTMRYEFDEKNELCRRMNIDLALPPEFPERYKKAIVRVMGLCSVKKQIMNPPEFIITAQPGIPAGKQGGERAFRGD